MGSNDAELNMPEAEIVHDMPTRTRFRIASHRRDEAYFASAEQVFRDCAVVRHVEVAPLTGSILIVHDGVAQDLVDHAAERELFSLREAVPVQKPVSSAFREAYQQADDWIRGRTEGTFDAKEALFVGLLAVAGIQLLRGQVLAPASNFLWYAIGLAAARSGAPDQDR